MPRLATLDRYLAKVTILGPDDCWPWTAAVDKDGYGIFWSGERYPHNNVPIMVKATRWGWKHYKGTDPGAKLVCHTCDDPPCQNPVHWFLGDSAANNDDMVSKGRGRGPGRGEAHFHARLTAEIVRDIRSRYAAGGVSQQTIANHYEIAREHVRDIIARKRWAHVE